MLNVTIYHGFLYLKQDCKTILHSRLLLVFIFITLTALFAHASNCSSVFLNDHFELTEYIELPEKIVNHNTTDRSLLYQAQLTRYGLILYKQSHFLQMVYLKTKGSKNPWKSTLWIGTFNNFELISEKRLEIPESLDLIIPSFKPIRTQNGFYLKGRAKQHGWLKFFTDERQEVILYFDVNGALINVDSK